MCKFCEERKMFNVIPTNFLKSQGSYEKIDAFIHASKYDKVAGLMIGNHKGYRYINICFFPICGKRLGGD